MTPNVTSAAAASAAATPIRVLIVDDQALFRSGIAMVINSQADLQVVGEAGTGHDALAVVEALNASDKGAPHIVLMDIRMPGLTGIDTTAKLVQQHPDIRVIVLTTFDNDDNVYGALEAGASGFLLKDVEPERLLDDIRTVAQGNAVIAPSPTKRMIEQFTALQHVESLPDCWATLTAREQEIVHRIGEGLSNHEIAEQLYISEATVKTHVSRILAKLDLRDRVQVVIFAFQHGLVH